MRALSKRRLAIPFLGAMIIVIWQTVGNESALGAPLLDKPGFPRFVGKSIEISYEAVHPQNPLEIYYHFHFFSVKRDCFQRGQENVPSAFKHKSQAHYCLVSWLRTICRTKIVPEDRLNTECPQFQWRPSRILHENARLINVVREDPGAGHAVNKFELEFTPREDGGLDSDHDAQLAFDMIRVPRGGAPQPICGNPQRNGEDSNHEGRNRANSLMVLSNENARTSFVPTEHETEVGDTLFKGIAGVLALAIAYALLKRF